jgi:AraC-like DNA-binding protein
LIVDNVSESLHVNGSLLTIDQWEQVAREADFNSAKMASLCSISERQLQRLFRQHLHCTPSHWLRELQCRLARELIAQGYSNKAAANELRFANESHFCREFKKVFGTSPQSFAPRLAELKSNHALRISKNSWNVLQSRAIQ